MKTIIEPFRIKMTEPIRLTTRTEREALLEEAHHNVFLLKSESVIIDLLTDSGTGAMSTDQWAAMMHGDESYAGSPSWLRFEETVRDITGFTHVFPTHQGRAAERILAQVLVKPGCIIPNNSHFDTTRANMEYAGANALDLLTDEGMDLSLNSPFKGNMDIDRLRTTIKESGTENVPFCMITVTNNTGGGQPVSLANIKAVKALLNEYGIPLIIDACRFAENAYFIQQREDGQQNRSLTEIAQEMFSYADGCTMSAKKDGLVNIGGFLCCNNDTWAEQFRNLLILTEGFPTYGGLAGRDLEAIAVGLREALTDDYQTYRHATVRYMSERLIKTGIPIVQPPGGHAVFLDAERFASHLSPQQFPGIGLVNALYLEGGIRAVELGSLMFGKQNPKTGEETVAPHELVRLAFPRRMYTQSHFDYVIEVLEMVWKQRKNITAHNITKQSPYLRHFTAELRPVNATANKEVA